MAIAEDTALSTSSPANDTPLPTWWPTVHSVLDGFEQTVRTNAPDFFQLAQSLGGERATERHALEMIDDPNLISSEYRHGHTLIIEGWTRRGGDEVAALEWNGTQWQVDWIWLGDKNVRWGTTQKVVRIHTFESKSVQLLVESIYRMGGSLERFLQWHARDPNRIYAMAAAGVGLAGLYFNYHQVTDESIDWGEFSRRASSLPGDDCHEMQALQLMANPNLVPKEYRGIYLVIQGWTTDSAVVVLYWSEYRWKKMEMSTDSGDAAHWTKDHIVVRMGRPT